MLSTSQIDEIFVKLSKERLQTYLNRSANKEQAWALYQENMALCADFIKPLQLCEVVLRNAIANALTLVHGEYWFKNQWFVSRLSSISQNELNAVLAKVGMNTNQATLIPNLSFAFWQSFLTRRLDAVLWNKAFFVVFDHASQKSVADNRLFLYQTLDEIRKFRNHIAHHEPIFNKNCADIYQKIITVVGFCSPSLGQILQKSYLSSTVFKTHSQTKNHALTDTWKKLEFHARTLPSLSQLFAKDNQRADSFHLSAPYMVLDYAKQSIDQTTLDHLLTLAKTRQLSQKIHDLISGQKVNASENRSALHTALRLPKDKTLIVDDTDIIAPIHASLDKCENIANRIRTGVWRGYSGKAITDVVSIGVGGSDLGPLMAVDALVEYKNTPINVHFASNMDGTHLQNLLGKLSPETTLFIIASKSFGTVDTLSNAKTALAWLGRHTTTDVALRRHFIGVSANPNRMTDWGIHHENQLIFWDFVGGRFSMWSTISLSVAIAIGMDNFKRLLKGAYEMDCHFQSAPLHKNAPVIMGLLSVWNATFLKIKGHTVLPYDGRLKFLPSYLTQLEMESNGKSVTTDGQMVDYATCPILWGEVGSNAQHAFYQLLHQGTQRVSCDFIACIHRYDGDETLTHQHHLTLSNCLAQSRVLAFGNDALPHTNNTSPNHTYRGNQPSTTILLDSLTPESLGSLIALYEHKVYVASVLWHINPFDQWGVEMGKVMANSVFDSLDQGKTDGFDSSTNFLLTLIKDGHAH